MFLGHSQALVLVMRDGHRRFEWNERCRSPHTLGGAPSQRYGRAPMLYEVAEQKTPKMGAGLSEHGKYRSGVPAHPPPYSQMDETSFFARILSIDRSTGVGRANE
jgi:hypothetical protein